MPRLLATTLLACITAPLALAAELVAPASDAPIYRSAFDNYQPWVAELPAPKWRAVNAEVEKLGGHAGHLRAAPATPAAVKGKMMDHSKMHGGKPLPTQQGNKP